MIDCRTSLGVNPVAVDCVLVISGLVTHVVSDYYYYRESIEGVTGINVCKLYSKRNTHY